MAHTNDLYFDTTRINTIQHSDIELETGISKNIAVKIADFINDTYPCSKFAVQKLAGTEFFHIKLTTLQNEKVTLTVGKSIFDQLSYSIKLHINDMWHCVKGSFIDDDNCILHTLHTQFNEKFKHYDQCISE